PTNGPTPWTVSHTAIADVRTAAVAASRGPNRKAAHTSHGMGTKTSGDAAAWPGSHPADPRRLAASSDANNSPISTDLRAPHWVSGSVLRGRSHGATRMTPALPPSP